MLDAFSDANVTQWTAAAHDLEAYQLQFFYGLEAQRKHDHGSLLRALQPARKDHVDLKNWCRLCTYKFSVEPFSAKGSVIGIGGRFNYGDALDNVDAAPFPALYLAESKATAFREKFQVSEKDYKRSGLGILDLALLPNVSVSLIIIDGMVENVLDLTRPKSLQSFVDVICRYKISKETEQLRKRTKKVARPLVKDTATLMNALYETHWRGWGRQFGLPSSSQTFGKLAWEAGFDAILYRSQKGHGRCLALFPDNLERSETEIRIVGGAPKGVATSLSRNNWQMSLS